MIREILKDLNLSISSVTAEQNRSKFIPRFQEAVNFLQEFEKHNSIHRSFAETLGNSAPLREFFFGSLTASIDSSSSNLRINHESNTLILVISNKTPPFKLDTKDADQICLHTDFETFDFYIVAEDGTIESPFATYKAEDLVEEIQFTKSLWASTFPVHHGIITRSIGYTLPMSLLKGTLFSDKIPFFSNGKSCEERASDLLQTFSSENISLLSIEDFAKNLRDFDKEIAPSQLLHEDNGRFVLRKYYPKRSIILDFGTPPEPFRRADWVTSYKENFSEFHREFFLCPQVWGLFEKDLRTLTFDFLHTLAIRRTSLFRHDFTSRLYNILLPPVLLNSKKDSSKFIIIYPCLLLNRIPNKGCFRNTFSITYSIFLANELYSETDETKLSSAKMPIGEFYSLKDEILSSHYLNNEAEEYLISGPLKEYVGLSFQASIPKLIHHITRTVVNNILAVEKESGQKKNVRPIDNLLYSQTRISNMATVLLQVDWAIPKGYSQPWEKWLCLDDSPFKKLLFKTISFRDYQTPKFGNTSLHAMDLKALNIGNVLGADMTGMTLFNPREEMKIILFPKSLEKYPNLSIVRWMTWHYYIDSAICALRVMIDKFHIILSERTHLNYIIRTLSNMVEEFVELYDLDLVNLFYRKEYEKIRNLLGIDSDYVQLISQFNSSKEDSSLREQRLINKLVFALTIATVTVSIISTIAATEQWSQSSYIFKTIAFSIFIIWFGYAMFDPARKLFETITSKFRKNDY